MDSKRRKLISIFEVVRDLPYGNIDSREPEQVLKEGKGTCSGKHLLLGQLYQAMGIEVQYMMCLTKFNFLEPIVPDNLKEILAGNEIFDYHNYLKIFSGEWIDVDATFDLALKRHGFIVNDNWDGESDCKIALQPIKTYCVNDLIAEKKRAVNELSIAKQRLRKKFIQNLGYWMELIRKG